MLANEAEQCAAIAKGFGASRFGHRVGGGNVGEGQAVFEFLAQQIGVNETGVKGVAGTDVIHYLDWRRGQAPLLITLPTYGGFGATFHNYNFGQSRQTIERLGKIVGSSDMLGLALIGQEDV